VIRDFVIASLALCLLALLISVLHLDRFSPGPSSVAWFAVFGIGAVAFASALSLAWRRPARIQAAARA
jgi:hypothetical protein